MARPKFFAVYLKLLPVVSRKAGEQGLGVSPRPRSSPWCHGPAGTWGSAPHGQLHPCFDWACTKLTWQESGVNCYWEEKSSVFLLNETFFFNLGGERGSPGRSPGWHCIFTCLASTLAGSGHIPALPPRCAPAPFPPLLLLWLGSHALHGQARWKRKWEPSSFWTTGGICRPADAAGAPCFSGPVARTSGIFICILASIPVGIFECCCYMNIYHNRWLSFLAAHP